MKLTKSNNKSAETKNGDESEEWSPEFWQASGSLGINLDGLNIDGTVDAAYYRAGVSVPSILSTPEIGSSNIEKGGNLIKTEDTTYSVDTIFTSGSFELAAGSGEQNSIFKGNIDLAQMKMTKDEGSWSPEYWQASGSLGINLDGIDLDGTVDAQYLWGGTKYQPKYSKFH